MTTPEPSPVVVINTYRVKPERTDELFDAVRRMLEIMKDGPGFLSSKLHVSLDQTRVAYYVEWRSKLDIDAMLLRAEAVAIRDKIARIAESADPVIYQIP